MIGNSELLYSGESARYEPEIHEVAELAGISLNVARKGEMVKVLQSAFFSSYDDDHQHYFGQILGQFSSLGSTLSNDLLIVIRNKQARVHTSFPLTVKIRSKGTIQRGSAVFKDQILDIEEVRFRDDFFEADIRDGDKIVWLFRVDWSFGLYFDLSGKSSTRELWKTLGQCYRSMHFHAVYAFFVDSTNPERLIDRGWFPFIQFSANEFSQLRYGIGDPSELDTVEAHIVQAFSADRIDQFSEGWWTNPGVPGQERNHRCWAKRLQGGQRRTGHQLHKESHQRGGRHRPAALPPQHGKEANDEGTHGVRVGPWQEGISKFWQPSVPRSLLRVLGKFPLSELRSQRPDCRALASLGGARRCCA